MGAYGDITCRWCGETHYELSPHSCSITKMRERISELQNRIHIFYHAANGRMKYHAEKEGWVQVDADGELIE